MKKLIKLNSSALRRSACMRRLDYTLSGYREVAVGNDIVFGTAFHDFVAEYRKNGQDLKSALAVGWAARDREPNIYTKYRKEHLDDFRYFQSVCLLWTMERSNWQTLQLGTDFAVELPWLVPFYFGEHVDVVLCGTVDDICEHKENPGVIAIRDYKTTSADEPDKFFAKFRLSAQLAFYYLGVSLMVAEAAKVQPQSLLANKWLNAASRYVMIEGVFLNKDINKCQFACSEAFEITAERLFEVESMVRELCVQLDKPEGYIWPRQGMINAACEGDYGRSCAYFDACAAGSVEDEEMLLRTQFLKEEYNPLAI